MWLVGVVIRRYIDILIIIINFPYSTCIRSFFGSSILTSLFIFKCFFGLWYIDFLIILLIPAPLVLALLCSSIPTYFFVHFKNVFFILVYVIFVQYSKSIAQRIEQSRWFKNRDHANIATLTVHASESQDFHVRGTA